MESFYGGRPGKDFSIVARFTDIATMLNDLTSSGSTIPLGSYVTLDVSSASELLQKVFDKNDAKYYNSNTKLGYNLICNIKGATGPTGDPGVSPEVTITAVTGGHSINIIDEAHPTGQNFTVLDGITSIQCISATLSRTSWDNNNNQTITVNGIVADESQQVIEVIPSSEDRVIYSDAGVEAQSQGNNSLTFHCITVPSVDLDVYIVISNTTYVEGLNLPILTSISLMANDWVEDSENGYFYNFGTPLNQNYLPVNGVSTGDLILTVGQYKQINLDGVENLIADYRNGQWCIFALGAAPSENLTINYKYQLISDQR